MAVETLVQSQYSAENPFRAQYVSGCIICLIAIIIIASYALCIYVKKRSVVSQRREAAHQVRWRRVQAYEMHDE